MKTGETIVPNKNRTYKIVACAFAIVAIVAAWLATAGAGPGLDPDASSYLSAAESFAHGDGLVIQTADWYDPQPTSTLAHFPPGYPVAIATLMKLGADAPQAARAIDALAAGGTVFTVVYLVATAVGLAPAAIAGMALLVSRPIVLVHLSVLSEPLFLALLALTLLAMARRAPPLLSGLVAALAALVRYAGVSVSAAVVFWELASPGTMKRRLSRATLAALPTIVLQGAWTIYVSATSGPKSIRELGIYHGFGDTLAEGARTIVAWLAPTTDTPGPARMWIGAIAAIAAGTVVALGVKRAIRDRHIALQTLAACGVLAACYVGVVVASRLVADAGIPFDERILAPLILLTTTAAVVAVATAWSHWGLLIRWGTVAALSAWVGLSGAASVTEALWSTTQGSDFASAQWRDSELLAWTRANAAELALYSNWPSALYFHDHRAAWMLPEIDDPKILKAFADTMAAHHALLIAFDAPSPDGVAPQRIAERVGLRVVIRLRDGTVYRPPFGPNEIIEP
jgi:hypothetical protein